MARGNGRTLSDGVIAAYRQIVAMMVDAEVIIVGAGTCGILLARELSANPRRRVILIESGPPVAQHILDIPLGRMPFSSLEQTKQIVKYPLVGSSVAPLGEQRYVYQGRGVGGSSVVNGGYFLPWHRSDFFHWSAEWTDQRITKGYRIVEKLFAATPLDNFLIPQVVQEIISRLALGDTVADGVYATEGVNSVPINRKGDTRFGANYLLEQISQRENLTVLSNCTVQQLITAETRVLGVRTETTEITAAEVILSAGTLGTAALVLGPIAAELNYADHIERTVSYRMVDGIPATDPNIPLLSTVIHYGGYEIRPYTTDLSVVIGEGASARGTIELVEMQGERNGVITQSADGRIQLRPPSESVSEVILKDFLQRLETVETIKDVVLHDEISFSCHASATLPMGVHTNALGELSGWQGVRVIDGSILPTAGSSGPHATVAMLAYCLGQELAKS